MTSSINELVFLLEEKSSKELLQSGVIEQFVPTEIAIRYIVFEGKQDLEKGIPRKLKAWKNQQAAFVILRDQDSEQDCVALKRRLGDLCRQSGRPDTLIRIACRELESWYLGDLQAVERGLGLTGLARKQNKYSKPDRFNNAKQMLQTMTKNKYQSVAGSRAISPYMNIKTNRSESFQVFVDGVRRITQSG